MADIEKVIKALECCTRLGCHHGCEYKANGYSAMTCRQELERDALELLKEQQAEIQKAHEEGFHDGYQQALSEMPNIVRCKDCKHWNDEEHDCNIKTGWFACGADWYCADGVRKGAE